MIGKPIVSVAAGAALAVSGAGGVPVTFGVAEDATKYAEDGGAALRLLVDLAYAVIDPRVRPAS